MKIIAVVGTGSGCGKTTVATRILGAFPGLGAVKISPREGAPRVEWGAGEAGKDTDLFARNGAARVARLIGPRETVGRAWESIKSEFEACGAVVIEGASALSIPGERYVVFVVAAAPDAEREERNSAIAAISDTILHRSSCSSTDSLIDDVRAFLTGAAIE